MNTKKLMLAAFLACTLAPALADEENGQPAPQRDVVVQGPVSLRSGDGKLTINTQMLRIHGRAVKNAPYSALEVVERQQTLADGNQIVNTTSTMSYRDSEGRMRIERRDRKGDISNVTITDPVADVSWSLRPQDKTATRVKSGEAMRAAAEASRAAAEASRASGEAARAAGRAAADAGRAAAARAQADQMRKDGKLAPDREGREIIVKRVERDNGDLRHVQENVRILAKEMTEDRVRALSNLEPLLMNAAGDSKWSSKGTTKDLGTRDMAGVKAQGKLRSYEIPAGEIGNKSPITVSDESWWSPELQITVYSRHSDPRTGDNVYRLDNLKREEPAAALFTVPSDYTVKDLAVPQIALKPAPKSKD